MTLGVRNNYLFKSNKPFFWLGDTAWLLFQNLNMEEIKRYLRNRGGLGYNVIQSVLIYSSPKTTDINEMSHGYKNPNDMEYWKEILEVVDYAKELNIYMALLPTWGSLVKNNALNIDEAKDLANFLGQYFKDKENIIWVLGGDVRGDVNPELFNTMGKILKEYNPNRLVTFHPFGRTGSYLWFNDKSWLDFNMFQSGHRRYDQLTLSSWDDKSMNEDSFGEDSFKYVIKNNSYKIKKPCLDAEPSYEGIVQGLHDLKEPYWEARHVRRYAYWSVFEGACGFTYGNNAIIQCHTKDKKGSYGVRESWEDGLHSPGGSQMQYLKNLMESVDFTKGAPHSEYILNQKPGHHRTCVFASEDYIFIYTYKGDKIKIDISKYLDKKMDAYYMNPENDSMSYIKTYINEPIIELHPTRRQELSNDWVIVLKESHE